MRKAQITMLVIVGMVLLFSSSLLITANRVIVQEQIQAQAESSIDSFLELNSINTYVTTCLEGVAREGLILLSQQGGVIYDDQGGLTSRDEHDALPYQLDVKDEITGEQRTIERELNYGIRNYVNCPAFQPPLLANIDDEPTSYYPVYRTPIADLVASYQNLFAFGGCLGLSDRTPGVSGFLGANNLPPLCSYDGINAYTRESISVCPAYAYDTPQTKNSMQRQLESYIEKNMVSCADFSFYEASARNEIIVDQEGISAQVAFQEPRGVIVRATYPFSVSVAGRAPIIKQVDFQTRLDVDVRSLYNFMFNVFLQTVRDPLYHIQEDWNRKDVKTGTFLKSTYNMDYIEQPCIACATKQGEGDKLFDDVVIFTDTSSLIRGQPLQFIFGIQDRKPILDLLANDLQDRAFRGQPVDYQVYVGDMITLRPRVVDPDDDSFTYSYAGWKEDYDRRFDYAALASGTCTADALERCYIDTPNEPKRWTTSELFTPERGVANYTTTADDVGFHNVTIIVTDEHGKQDFQIVRILVFDSPVAKANPSSALAGINDSHASIEDPYYLDLSDSTASFVATTGISQFVITDLTEKFVAYTADTLFRIPNSTYDLALLIKDMYRYNFTAQTLRDSGEKSQEHEFRLVVEQDTGSGVYIRSEPYYFNITVSECLPYRYQDNGDGVFNPLDDYPQYDYLSGPSFSEEIDQPHMCCQPNPVPAGAELQGGTFASTAESCYLESFTTLYPDKNKGEYYLLSSASIDTDAGEIVDYEPGSVHAQGYDYNTAYPTDYAAVRNNAYHDKLNDIFTVSYEQACSGYRGNSCGGEVTTVWTTAAACNDFGQIAGQYARCQGPGVNLPFTSTFLTNINTKLQDNVVCRNFPAGQTFERNALGYTQGRDGTPLDSNGFCGPTKIQTVNFVTGDLTDVVSTSKGGGTPLLPTITYSCNPTCNSATGECDYHQKNQCMCEKGNECDGLLASSFYNEDGDGTVDNVYCLASTVADRKVCTAQCLYTESLAAAACYCEYRGTAGPAPANDAINFPRYLAGTGWQSTRSNGATCCVGSDTIITKSTATDGSSVCYNGNIYADEQWAASNRIYSKDGQLYGCCSDGSCASAVNYKQTNGGVVGSMVCYDNSYRSQGFLNNKIYLGIQEGSLKTIHQCCTDGSCSSPRHIQSYGYGDKLPFDNRYVCGANGATDAWGIVSIANSCPSPVDDPVNPRCNLENLGADCDGDSLPNGMEKDLDYNPCDTDTDDDGFADNVDLFPRCASNDPNVCKLHPDPDEESGDDADSCSGPRCEEQL